jgi:hypothetical protein
MIDPQENQIPEPTEQNSPENAIETMFAVGEPEFKHTSEAGAILCQAKGMLIKTVKDYRALLASSESTKKPDDKPKVDTAR